MATNISSNISAAEIFKPLTTEAINAPHKTQGTYSQPQSDTVELSKEKAPKEPKKKNKFWKALGWVVLIGAALGGSLVAINNKTTWFNKIEKYGGKQLQDAAKWTENNAVKAWDGIKNGFNSIKEKLTPKAKDAAEKTA